MHAKTVKLLPEERIRWWWSQRFHRRVRMRALVRGAVNDVAVNDARTSILLDTGANVSIITTKLARRLRLDPIQEHGRQLEVQGIQEGKMSTTTRVKVKVTLGWNTVYEFEFWVIGTDFVIPAGIRLDLFNATAKLPGEEMVPLAVYCPAHLDVIACVLRGFMPNQAGYVPTDSRKYEQCQVLAYAGSHETWFKLKCELYGRWLASQPTTALHMTNPNIAETRRVLKQW
ncbi:hypothetical protein PHMEG_00011229 [Phytophthora megakarya]|uniref:Peptidase A2 domain-containing protein n=1 Tax=Phytophthora megakarya TaxID=4795 RepID=A0A225WD46_9STRA|nr:hypothetical protein PHMEG_00011229 [Phytophthora megakarya]